MPRRVTFLILSRAMNSSPSPRTRPSGPPERAQPFYLELKATLFDSNILRVMLTRRQARFSRHTVMVQVFNRGSVKPPPTLRARETAGPSPGPVSAPSACLWELPGRETPRDPPRPQPARKRNGLTQSRTSLATTVAEGGPRGNRCVCSGTFRPWEDVSLSGSGPWLPHWASHRPPG